MAKAERERALSKSKFFIDDLSIKQIIKLVVSRTLRLIIVTLRSNKPRYVVLTPSILCKQIIYDREQKKYLSIIVRDFIDIATLGQIYVADDYGTSKLKRHNDIELFYKKSTESGKKPLIIDCGGNIGLASKYFSDNYREAKIICIEPDAANLEQAKKNNLFTEIDFLKAAIGSENGTGQIVDPGLGNNAYRISNTKSGQTQILSINELLKIYPDNNYIPFIIKIDIEGFEDDLFSKNIEWIDSFPLLIIELHDWMLPNSSNSKNFLKAISQLDRDFVYIGENVFSISNTILKPTLWPLST
jgi:FkbM family methyltransferase